MKFVGVDLGWYGKPTGLAVLDGQRRIVALDRVSGVPAILAWIDEAVSSGPAMIAIDAPTVIANATGTRRAEQELNARYRRYHAGCHAANLGRPFAALTTGFAQKLADRGFAHADTITPRQPGRYQIEVHPHAASVELFGLDRIVKYKKGRFAERAAELARLRGLIADRLGFADLPAVPERGGAALKAAEDRIDAVLAAYAGWHWWRWGIARTAVFGCAAEGFIVVPQGNLR